MPISGDYEYTISGSNAIPFYTVTYNGNGNTSGTVPVDSNFYAQGATVIVLDNPGFLEKTGYVFAGWNTRADGTGTNYAAGATFTMGTANVILYAKWNQSVLGFRRKCCINCTKKINCQNNFKPLCDQSGGIPINRTTDLQNGSRYITPVGAVITWMGNAINVCEPETPADFWIVFGIPLQLGDATGKVQQVPTQNALIILEDNSCLLIGTTALDGTISKARFIPQNTLGPVNLQGYSTNATEVYTNDANKSKISQGTVAVVFGF